MNLKLPTFVPLALVGAYKVSIRNVHSVPNIVLVCIKVFSLRVDGNLDIQKNRWSAKYYYNCKR